MKVLLVDDKESVVQGIRKHVPWDTLGVSQVEIALDGAEALQIDKEFQADLIITDIKMPNVNGIELMNRLRSDKRVVRFIVLSGYDEFDYAKQAISLGASEYVLKPVDIKELTGIIEKELKEVRSQLELEEQRQQFQQKMRVSLPALRQQYLSEMVTFHDHRLPRLKEKWEFAEVPVNPDCLVLLVIAIDGFMDISQQPVEEVELTRFIVENIISDCLSSWGNGIAFYSEWGRLTVLVNYDPNGSGKEVKGQLLQFAEYCRTAVERNSHITVTVGLSSLCPDIKELPEGYRQACEAIEHVYFFGSNQIVHYEDLSGYGLRRTAYPASEEQGLVVLVKRGQTDELAQAVERFFEALHGKEGTPIDIRLSSIQLIAVLYRLLLDAGMDDRLSDDFRSTWQATFEGCSLAELKAHILEICTEAAQQVKLWIKAGSKNIVEQAKQYIEEHLQSVITLPTVADYVGVSPNYLSSLFKKETGITFLEFVTDRKVSLAKEWLINPEIPIYEIAERLGYNDRRYFREIFKKKAGKTPSEFRDSLLGTHSIDE